VEIRLTAYGPDTIEETLVRSKEELQEFVGNPGMLWVDVDRLGDNSAVEMIGEVFHLHPLALEDVVNTRQRPKVESYDGHYYIVAHMASFESGLKMEQLSLFLGKGFVITFQEWPGDCLEPVRERLRKGTSKIRSRGADYLAYSLLDAVIDGYFPVLEIYGERLEELEDAVIIHPTPAAIADIHEVKRELLTLRRSIWPLREAMAYLYHEETTLIAEETRPYFRDCYDHTIRIMDLIETFRELSADLMDVYLSSVSNRINGVMKVLTVITTIFIPLTFIVGLYGMNFHNMPELRSRYGYPITLAVMGVIAVALLLVFWRRGWLTSESTKPD
jgi:magnesium transporter